LARLTSAGFEESRSPRRGASALGEHLRVYRSGEEGIESTPSRSGGGQKARLRQAAGGPRDVCRNAMRPSSPRRCPRLTLFVGTGNSSRRCPSCSTPKPPNRGQFRTPAPRICCRPRANPRIKTGRFFHVLLEDFRRLQSQVRLLALFRRFAPAMRAARLLISSPRRAICGGGVPRDHLIAQDLTAYGRISSTRSSSLGQSCCANSRPLTSLRLDTPALLLSELRDRRAARRNRPTCPRSSSISTCRCARRRRDAPSDAPRALGLGARQAARSACANVIPGVVLRTSFIVAFPGED